MARKTLARLALILAMSFALSACVAANEATGDVNRTLTGQLMGGASSGYVLLTEEGKTVTLESPKIDLKSYVGSKVSLTGQFSGSTLYVDGVD